MTSLEQDVLDHQAKFYERQVHSTAAMLRKAADDLERDALRVQGPRGLSYTYAASRAVHTAMWGIANAHLDSIVSAAGDADDARLALAVAAATGKGEA
jgi:hypothetical protein